MMRYLVGLSVWPQQFQKREAVLIVKSEQDDL